MNQKPNFLSVKPSVVENDVKQEVGRNQGQAVGQMNDSQAVSAREIGVFVSGGSVVYQNSSSQVLSQQKKAIPSLLPYLANRSEQEFELCKRIQTHLQQRQNRPFICIIHGDEFQCHDKFLERLQKISLPRMLKLDSTKVGIKDYLLHWPSGVKNLEKLSEHLCKHLGDEVKNDSFASTEEINQSFCQYPAPIIVHTHLLTQDWEGKGAKSLYKLLDFWNNWPELGSNQKLIVCIFIKYQFKQYKSRGFLCLLRMLVDFLRTKKLKILPKCYRYCKLNEAITKELHKISQSEFSQFEKKLNGVVLPELSGISRTHVENWVRAKETKEFIGETKVSQFIKSVREIFEQCEDNTMSMENLADRLIELLEELISSSDYLR